MNILKRVRKKFNKKPETKNSQEEHGKVLFFFLLEIRIRGKLVKYHTVFLAVFLRHWSRHKTGTD